MGNTKQKQILFFYFTCGGSNPTTADDIIYPLVSSAVDHQCQCKGSMNVLHQAKFIDTYSLGHWGRADVVPRCPDVTYVTGSNHNTITI